PSGRSPAQGPQHRTDFASSGARRYTASPCAPSPRQRSSLDPPFRPKGIGPMGATRPGGEKMRPMRLQTRLGVLFAVFVLATASLAGVSTAALDDEETVAFDAPTETIPAPDPAPAPDPDP